VPRSNLARVVTAAKTPESGLAWIRDEVLVEPTISARSSGSTAAGWKRARAVLGDGSGQSHEASGKRSIVV
jgi:hypothetical protein